ncbi:MAG: DUF975 family protein [Paludibacteraceae bacterium]
MKQNSEYRAQARAALEGRWTEAVLMYLILIVVAFAFSVPLGVVSGVYAARLPWLAESMSGCTFLVSVLLVMPLGYGLSNALLSFLRSNEEATSGIREMWLFFRRDYSRSVPALLLVTVFVSLLGIVTLGIGAIVLNYAYAMVPYLLRDYPELGIREALRTSKQMMKGHKWDLFVLDLSFIGWLLLGIMTAGVGLLWVAPYMDTTHAAFYEDLKNECIDEE